MQVLEDGRLTDNKGRLIDFSNSMLILTSNVGSRVIYDCEYDHHCGDAAFAISIVLLQVGSRAILDLAQRSSPEGMADGNTAAGRACAALHRVVLYFTRRLHPAVLRCTILHHTTTRHCEAVPLKQFSTA